MQPKHYQQLPLLRLVLWKLLGSSVGSQLKEPCRKSYSDSERDMHTHTHRILPHSERKKQWFNGSSNTVAFRLNSNGTLNNQLALFTMQAAIDVSS